MQSGLGWSLSLAPSDVWAYANSTEKAAPAKRSSPDSNPKKNQERHLSCVRLFFISNHLGVRVLLAIVTRLLGHHHLTG